MTLIAHAHAPRIRLRARWVGSCLLAIGLVAALNLPAGASAAVNKRINFQGRLADPAGMGVPDGTYNVEFKLHGDGALAGGGQGVCSGSCLWMETRTGVDKVTVSRGLFSVQLGEVASLASFNFDQDPLFLSIRVGGTAGVPVWDGEMTPRHRLGAAPQAIHADNASQLGGQAPSFYTSAGNLTGTVADARLSSNVALRNANNSFSASQTVTGTVTATDLTCADCLNAGDVAAGAIGTSEIADGAVSLADLAANSVDSSKIVDGSIAAADIDQSVWSSKAHLSGTLATRPAAAPANDGQLYFATDDKGGTMYRSNGSAWVKVAPGVGEVGSASYAHVTHSVGQSIPNQVWTPLAMDTERLDTDAYHSTVTNNTRLTAPVAGLYHVVAQAAYQHDPNGMRGVAIFKNGISVAANERNATTTPGYGSYLAVSSTQYLNAGDYIEAYTHQASGLPLTVAKVSNSPELSMFKVDGSVGTTASGPAGGDLTGSYPNPTLAAGSVNSAKIVDGSVTAADLAAPATLQASSSVEQTGVYNADVVYDAASVTLTTGTWLVTANATLASTDVFEAHQLGLFNATAGADIANTKSAVVDGAAGSHKAMSTSGVVQVASGTMVLKIKGYRNGTSTLRIGYPLVLGDEQRITAVRLSA